MQVVKVNNYVDAVVTASGIYIYYWVNRVNCLFIYGRCDVLRALIELREHI